MATYTDTGTKEKIETIQDRCDICKDHLSEFVIRGDRSGVVINRIRLYQYSPTRGLSCEGCSTPRDWRRRQALR